MAKKYIYGIGKTLDEKTIGCRSLVGIFNRNVKQIKAGRVFINDGASGNMLLENYGRFYKSTKWSKTSIILRGAVKEMLGEELVMEYPEMLMSDGEDVTKYMKDNVVMRWLVKDRLIDDEMLCIIKGVFDRFYFIYDSVTNLVGMCLKRLKNVEIVDLEGLLDKEIELGYINMKIGDKQRRHGYTHILRRNLELRFQTWQKTMLMGWSRFNLIAGSRRIGKTYTSAYIGYRELYRVGGGYGKRERQILYICVSEDKMWQPMQYMSQMVKRDIELGYIKKVGNEFHNLLTGAKLIFRTANSRTGAASYGADLIILDEGAMISDAFWEDLLPIIMQEKATVFAISTINEDIKTGWFYSELLKGELGDDPKYNCIRVTIDDNELLTEDDREATKDALRHNPIKYWTQLYSIFPSGNSVFRLTGVIQPEEDIKPVHVVIGYDPGKVKDDAALVVIDTNRLRVIEDIRLQGMEYMDQKDEIAELKKKYTKSAVIMDRTGVGEAVWEIVRDHIDVSVKYKGKGEITYNSRFNYYNVNKGELVDMCRVCIDTMNMSIDSGLLNLITQMKGFKKIRIGTVTQYQGEGIKDDSVNGLLLACFYIIRMLGISGKGQISNIAGVLEKLNFNDMDDDDFGLTIENLYNDDVIKKFIY